MKIAILDNFNKPRGEHVGRAVANYHAMKAILEYSDAEVVYFGNKNIDHVFAGIRNVTQLPKALEENEFDMVLLEDPFSKMLEVLQLRNMGSKTPVVSLVHTLSYKGMRQHLENVSKLMTNEKDAIICPSLDVQQLLSDWMGRLFLSIPYPIEMGGLMEFAPIPKEDRPITGLYWGRIKPNDKANLVPMIRAFKLIHEKNKNSRLIIGGSGDEQYISVLTRYVHLCGLDNAVEFVTHDRKQYAFNEADFLIAPADSLQETYGLVLLEAKSQGMPIVASDIAGYRDICQDGIDMLINTVWGKVYDNASLVMDDELSHAITSNSFILDFGKLFSAMDFMYSRPRSYFDSIVDEIIDNYSTHYTYRVFVGSFFYMIQNWNVNIETKIGDNNFDFWPSRMLQNFDRVCPVEGQDLEYEASIIPVHPILYGNISKEEVMEMIKKQGFVSNIVKNDRDKFVLCWCLKNGLLKFSERNQANII